VKPLGYGRINHSDEFYNDQEVVVWSETVIAGVAILTVTLPTGTGNGRIQWSVRKNRLADFIEADL
jgi:hypothetical protein